MDRNTFRPVPLSRSRDNEAQVGTPATNALVWQLSGRATTFVIRRHASVFEEPRGLEDGRSIDAHPNPIAKLMQIKSRLLFSPLFSPTR